MDERPRSDAGGLSGQTPPARGAGVLAWALALAGLVAALACWTRVERARRDASVALFSRAQPGCAVVIPVDAIDAERRAAEMIQETLAKAAGRTAADFPIVAETAALRFARAGVYVGATRRARDFMTSGPKPPYDTAVGWRVRDGVVAVRSERRESAESAASWFLEDVLGAHWFMPGPLGEYVPQRDALVLAATAVTTRPGFISRDLQMAGEDARAWQARNRLEARFEHQHNLGNIFRPVDFAREPEMAPMRSGGRYLPAEGDQNWQPNLVSPAAARHAAAAAIRAFDANPAQLSFSLSENDSIRFDDSPETLAAVGPPRFFRHRPDYSNAVFGFANAVAALVARSHPDRWLPSYAYYWAENTPAFRVAPRVVPFLTADRTQWSHPDFAAEDKALIERWCRSGAEIVGVYDYFYGAPFLVPRPTLHTVTETIPFEHRAGVRAFYAETYSNWALDGPKAWLAAQLLWSPERNPAELLATYYREFWGEAAEPMREFYALCDRTWREQPGPALWLRYFKDDDQAKIYGAERRAELRAKLDRAANAATNDLVRARVAFATAGFAVSEAFWQFDDARDRLSRLARTGTPPATLRAAWEAYRRARQVFAERHAAIRREHPFALSPQDVAVYFRNRPDSRVARELARTAAGREVLRDAAFLPLRSLGATGRDIAAVLADGVEALDDASWEHLAVGPVGGATQIEWTAPDAAWHGSGEPWEGRSVRLLRGASGDAVLRMSNCRTEGIGQWLAVDSRALYAAQVKVRAKSSPGTATFLIVSFLDDQQRHIGLGTIDRLPPDAAVQETELCVIAKPPAGARYIGFGVRVLNQIEGDFAEFSAPSLRQLSE